MARFAPWLLVTYGAALSCAAVRPTPASAPAPAAPVSTLSAATSIVEAMCDRRQRCEVTGTPQYDGMDPCSARERSDVDVERVFAEPCRVGVSSAGLDQCLSHIRSHSCEEIGRDMDSAMVASVCDRDNLCFD
ncbi:MAG: hypothetical protein HOW73_40820 [Polyangiaceae bacterium]|nr:hypothetical protein [Polyangiaceae bacterium]